MCVFRQDGTLVTAEGRAAIDPADPQASVDCWRNQRAGGDWLRTIGLQGQPLWAWPSYGKFVADPYIQVTTQPGGSPL